VAPLCYYTVPNGLACGTSIAAPQVAAAAARLLSYNSELKGWPEGLRAILQATADQHVDGEVWHTPGVDLKGGTGLLNVDRAFYAAQTRLTADATTNLNNGGVYGYAHGYAVGSLDRDTTPSVTYTVTVPPTPNPSCLIPHLRIAVAFDAAPVEANRADAEDILDADIDLIVTRGTDNAPASCYFANESFLSASYDNSYEFIECHVTNPDPNSTYKITVQGKGFNRSTAWYGLAVAKNDWAYGLNCF